MRGLCARGGGERTNCANWGAGPQPRDPSGEGAARLQGGVRGVGVRRAWEVMD